MSSTTSPGLSSTFEEEHCVVAEMLQAGSHPPTPEAYMSLPSLVVPDSPGSLAAQTNQTTSGERKELLKHVASRPQPKHAYNPAKTHVADHRPFLPSPSYSYPYSYSCRERSSTPTLPSSPGSKVTTLSSYAHAMYTHTLTQLGGLDATATCEIDLS
ncbi:hypothetical protein MBLNU459_g2062t3 [Dothideomycetes sp. NU459]